jgi:hypothetical protein
MIAVRSLRLVLITDIVLIESRSIDYKEHANTARNYLINIIFYDIAGLLNIYKA